MQLIHRHMESHSNTILVNFLAQESLYSAKKPLEPSSDPFLSDPMDPEFILADQVAPDILVPSSPLFHPRELVCPQDFGKDVLMSDWPEHTDPIEHIFSLEDDCDWLMTDEPEVELVRHTPRIFGLFDFDPHGIEIYLCYKYGSPVSSPSYSSLII